MDKFKELIKTINETKDKDSGIEMKLLDKKNDRVLYCSLTVMEVLNLFPIIESKEWRSIPLKRGENK